MTDEATLEVAEMVLCGLVNKGISSLISQKGARAVGISGRDDGLLVGEKVTRTITDENGAKKVGTRKGKLLMVQCGGGRHGLTFMGLCAACFSGPHD